jgi:hypothetical protein
MKEGVTNTMKRRKRVGAGHTPHGWLPLSPIYIGYTPLLSTHLVLSIPYLVAPHHGCCLSKALPTWLATNTWRSGGGGVPANPYFRCPLDRGHGGCHQTIHVTEYGGAAGCGALYTILRSSSLQLRRLRMSSSSLHRQRLCMNVNPASCLRGLVNRCFHLVDDLG